MRKKQWSLHAAFALGLVLPIGGHTQPMIEEQEIWCPYTSIAMLAEYSGEEYEGGYYDTPVRYLDSVERRSFRVFVSGGLLVNSKGYPIDGEEAAFQGEEDASHKAIFAMDHCGRIYLTHHHYVGEFHHSSFLAGGPVASAGEMVIVDGRLLVLNNSSGHYRPPTQIARQVVQHLRRQGADMSMAKIEMIE
ncbi:MAG: hypothetical protein VX589_05885 [Myxococcota bacterium]|nr:hypothetical protein [Myxococcota bacterium]